LTNPPPEDAKDRCVKQNRDTAEEVKKTIAPYFAEIEGIKKMFPIEIVTNVPVVHKNDGAENAAMVVAKIIGK